MFDGVDLDAGGAERQKAFGAGTKIGQRLIFVESAFEFGQKLFYLLPPETRLGLVHALFKF
jgi:hypothetical protein